MSISSISSVVPTAHRGWVYFIGAGPGDPGLLTLRGAELLRQATIVFYDRLVGDEMLALVSPDAHLVDVGKESTAGGESQLQINDLLVEAARQNHIVARLKGGDPFVFGRGGEEALACALLGIPFEVVPGVTSAIAAPAYAGIPVTHRGLASGVCIVTGHGANDNEPDLDWRALARSGCTLVILMGVGRIESIAARLIEGGRDPQTPVALVRHGTRSDQETLVSTLSQVAAEVKLRGFQSPAAFVVGAVAQLREQLEWFERRPLFGWRVAVTRPAGEAEELNARLRAAGAAVLHCPTIRIVPLLDRPQLTETIGRLLAYDWVILTSVNGVRCFFAALARAGRDARALAGARVAVIGSKTGEELAKHGVRPDLVPAEFSQEGVLAAMGEVKGKRILLARAAEARDVLPDTLRERGALVDVEPLYETVADEAGVERLVAALREGAVDWITFTSASTARFLLRAIPPEERVALLGRCKLASIGPSTSAALREAGLTAEVQAKVYTSAGLFDAMLEYPRRST